MGMKAYQVTRMIATQDGSVRSTHNEQVSVVVHGVDDAGEALTQGAAQLGVPPSQCMAEEFETVGLGIAEAIAQAEQLDREGEAASQMAGWLGIPGAG